MGNEVVGEAFREYVQANPGGSPLVETYIASQAAVSADAYGDPSTTEGFIQDGPFLFQHWPDGLANQPGYYAGNGPAASNWVNFYNPVDYALSAWSWNNYLNKPQKLDSSVWEYDYAAIPDANMPSGYDYVRYVTTWVFIQINGVPIPVPLVDNVGAVTNPFEILAFVSQSHAGPVGAQYMTSIPGGVKWNENFDLNDKPYYVGDTRPEHSFQFEFSIARTWSYWEEVDKQLGK